MSKYYIALFSVHGLIRGNDIELGRDADTGGQVTYVVELARELGKLQQVERVDLFTRQIFDSRVSEDYAQPSEQLSERAFIIRLPFGPRRYLRKEVLWPHLESLVDKSIQHFRRLGRVPNFIHGHYADAGYVGAMLANLLEVPFVFTGHSLGLVKRARLLEKGLSEEKIEEEYHIGYRIEAEERALNAASMVVASTRQEIQEQYEHYQDYNPNKMKVIPPGVNLDNFYPLKDEKPNAEVYKKIARFLKYPHKPMLLALSRADERKNLAGLIQAYGEHPQLQELANLVIIAGNRDDIKTMDKGTQRVLTQILLDIDKYDLYGHVAYPKQHQREQVPDFYRLATAHKGIFVNPALTEPFGITLIEAAATGLPIVATHDGGPQDIIDNCQNGVLIDPLDTQAIAKTLMTALTDQVMWRSWSKHGIDGVRQHYSWRSHAENYLHHMDAIIAKTPSSPMYKKERSGTFSLPKGGRSDYAREAFGRQLSSTDRVIIADIDNTLIGDAEALAELMAHLHQANNFSFGIATGRTLESAQEVLEEWDIPIPDVFITSVGSEIYYGQNLVADKGWQKHIRYRWQPEEIKKVLSEFEGLTLQPEADQRHLKLSYIIDTRTAPKRREIVKQLRQHHLLANVIVTYGQFLDFLPTRASKGLAIRYLAFRWGVPMERFIVAGDSGNDEEMLRGDTLGIVVGNYSRELEKLRGRNRIYFAQAQYARGILEGLNHFNFLTETETQEEAYET
ncbi:MAG: HAD-IIB family hydrolase [Pseudomonadota bacterium]|nr:HAD-IIB family hydrolase [Pseudomonadota bacterium]